MKSISKTFVVGKQDTAAVMGSGLLDVLATPTMVAWMENTSILLTEEYLKEGDTTVGICINTFLEKVVPLPTPDSEDTVTVLRNPR